MADAIARQLTRDHADEEQLTAATEVARAVLKLIRMREVRAKLMAEMDLTSGSLEHLRRFAALDRYERFAANEPNLIVRCRRPRGKEANQESLTTAAEFAEAQLELFRIRATRTVLMTKTRS
jgi:hypothetical protein